uniref:DUF444 family protein n=1 Tax=Ascaris lumbricoides TaxID=6252 RepID=A0A0M3IX80_ASCLU
MIAYDIDKFRAKNGRRKRRIKRFDINEADTDGYVNAT